MHIEFDPDKNLRNIRERGLPFERAQAFDFETAIIVVDTRRDYGEIRFRALGFLDGRLHALVFAGLPDGIRIISFRKANQREVMLYETQTST